MDETCSTQFMPHIRDIISIVDPSLMLMIRSTIIDQRSREITIDFAIPHL